MFTWLINHRWFVLVALAAAGSTVLFLSWVAGAGSWFSGALVNAGTALLLFGPLVLVSREIARRFDAVQATQEQIELRQQAAATSIESLGQEVAQTQAELRRTREGMSTSVAGGVAEKRNEDRELFASVESIPSHNALFRALVRATELRLTSDTGCRVPVPGTNLFFCFETPVSIDLEQEAPDPASELWHRIETLDGAELTRLSWGPDQSADDFLLRLAEALIQLGKYPGDDSFRAGEVLGSLSELLDVVHASATGGRDEPLSRVVQYCPPQWVVTEDFVACVARPYSIPLWRLMERDWAQHLRDRYWVDRDSLDDALEAGIALRNGQGRREAHQPRSSEDAPPFSLDPRLQPARL